MSFGFVSTICGLIILLLLGRAIYVVRQEREAPRGSEPGKGVNVISSDYMSGMGGGSFSQTRIPRDPDAYARAFVPKNADKKGK